MTEGRIFAPESPGAVRSPQQPGQLPDVSHVPGYDSLPIALPADGPKRPTTQHSTAEDILNVWERTGKDVLDPDRFTQATVSYEEWRKANPGLRKPARPQAGYALSVSGMRLSDQLAAIAAQATATEATE